jgi:hypothetical protein
LALHAGVEDERPTVLLNMPLDTEGPIDRGLLLHMLMWIVPFSASDVRLRRREVLAARGI